VLEHHPDPDAFLTEVRRGVAAGGHVLITTPDEPNVLQRSFWSRKRRKKLAAAEGPGRLVTVNGREAPRSSSPKPVLNALPGTLPRRLTDHVISLYRAV
jgi:hypothetical protein